MNSFRGIIDIYDENDHIEFTDAWNRGVRAVLHETSRGLYEKDSRYQQRKQLALAHGFLWAGYHLVSAEDIPSQLERVLSIEDCSDPRVGLALDWEKTAKGTATSDQIRQFVQLFNTAMKAKGYPDRYPILYGGDHIREDPQIIRGDPLLAKCPLWYVFVHDNPVHNTRYPFPTNTWPSYTLWQYDTEKRTHGGPPTSVLPGADWNQYDGTEDDLRNAWPFGGVSGTSSHPIHPLSGEFVAMAAPPVAGFAGKAAAVALQEWDFWGKQTYDIHGKATSVGHKETQDGWYQRVGTYWKDGANLTGIDGTNTDWPWSAAFISWVMKTAGAKNRFRYSSQHSVYVAQSILDYKAKNTDAGYWGVRLNEEKPSVGDIVCWAREPGISYKDTHGGDYKGHCDLIIAVNNGQVEVIGGNVGDSVTRRVLALDQGYVAERNDGGEYLFALMKNRIDVS